MIEPFNFTQDSVLLSTTLVQCNPAGGRLFCKIKRGPIRLHWTLLNLIPNDSMYNLLDVPLTLPPSLTASSPVLFFPSSPSR